MRERGSARVSNFKSSPVAFTGTVTADNITKFGFLLEEDLLEAIEKGNHGLLHIARNQIRYLWERIPEKLLTEALAGKEEAIIALKTDLFNSGDWERAHNLKSEEVAPGQTRGKIEEIHRITIEFIWAHKDMVHPNTINRDLEHDNDAVRMALNQIHYGTIRQKKKIVKERAPSISEVEHKEKMIKFIFLHKDKVKEQTMQGVIYNSANAISEAIRQINHKSENPKQPPVSGETTNQTYRDTVLKSKSPIAADNQPPRPRTLRNPIKKKLDLYFTGFSDEVTYEEIWKVFKQRGRIKDIVFPTKRDRWSKKYGFVKLFSQVDAEVFLAPQNPVYIRGNRISFNWAKGKRSNPRLSDRDSRKAVPAKGEFPRSVPHVSDPSLSNNHKSQDSPKDNGSYRNDGAQEWIERMARSVRVELDIDYAPDVLQERLVAYGIYQVEVLKISPFIFMFSCATPEDKVGLNLHNLDLKVINQRDVETKDLIIPRVTTIGLQGLPISAYSKSVLESIASRWGILLNKGVSCISNQHLVNPLLYISTTSLHAIEESIEVEALGQIFTVNVKEDRVMQSFNIGNSQSWARNRVAEEGSISVTEGSEKRGSEKGNSQETVSNWSFQAESDFQEEEELTKSSDIPVTDYRTIISSDSDSELRLCDPIIDEIEYRHLRTQDWNIGVSSFDISVEDKVEDLAGRELAVLHQSARPEIPVLLDSWKVREEKSSDEDSFTNMVQSPSSCPEGESDLESLGGEDHSSVIHTLQDLKIKQKCGRARKVRKLSFFDFKIKAHKNRLRSAKWSPGMYVRPWNGGRRKTNKHGGSPKRSYSSFFRPFDCASNIQAIWHLGEKTGLIPVASKERTLALLADRI
ncbi:hypothetical protein ACET3Z_004292 [Daucus carota]